MSSDRPVSKHIVVGVDGSEPSKHALRWADFMARTTGATIHVICAWQPPMYWAGAGWLAPPSEWDPAADAKKILGDTLADVFGANQPTSLTTSVEEGGAARVLLDASEQASLLVVGSRGHGGFAGLLLGSVSSACAEHATCPVLVVHGRTSPPPT